MDRIDRVLRRINRYGILFWFWLIALFVLRSPSLASHLPFLVCLLLFLCIYSKIYMQFIQPGNNRVFSYLNVERKKKQAEQKKVIYK